MDKFDHESPTYFILANLFKKIHVLSIWTVDSLSVQIPILMRQDELGGILRPVIEFKEVVDVPTTPHMIEICHMCSWRQMADLSMWSLMFGTDLIIHLQK